MSGDVFLSRPERVGGPGRTGPRRDQVPGMGPAPGRGPGPGRTGIGWPPSGPVVYAARKLRNRRTRSAMGGWVLKSWPAPPDSGLTVYRWAMAAGTGCCAG